MPTVWLINVAALQRAWRFDGQREHLGVEVPHRLDVVRHDPDVERRFRERERTFHVASSR